MVSISDIQGSISEQLAGFDDFVATHFRSDESAMQAMLADALASRGKGVRPMLVFLTFGLCGGVDCGSVGRANIAAMMCEMIHLASLIHDDVLDESSMRRGRPTLNSVWQSKRAVLAGDYILAKNLSVGMGSGEFDLVAHIVEAIGRLCEGEVLQDDCAKRGVASLNDYMRVIELKTASLLSVSASSGGLAAGAGASAVATLGEFGRLVGLAFQIQDDILDYGDGVELGKDCGQDLREGKFTLPLLMAMDCCGDCDERAGVAELVRGCVAGDGDFERVMSFVQLYNGVDLSRKKAEEYIASAHRLLSSFDDSKYKTSLFRLCDYVLERLK
ncbi:MAG: polyprenyl synthetase family protein [Rikenellaceae bacterium]